MRGDERRESRCLRVPSRDIGVHLGEREAIPGPVKVEAHDADRARRRCARPGVAKEVSQGTRKAESLVQLRARYELLLDRLELGGESLARLRQALPRVAADDEREPSERFDVPDLRVPLAMVEH